MKARSYGSLEVTVGPMYSGKSTRLLKEAFWSRDQLRRNVVILKPEMDKRYAVDKIVTHGGISIEAIPVDRWPALPDDVDMLFCDEIQFFTAPWFSGDLIEHVREALRSGIDVYASGLDMDWRGEPFRVAADLVAMADVVNKVHSACSECGGKATKNFKLRPNGLSVEIGAGEMYQARCNRHWHDHAVAD